MDYTVNNGTPSTKRRLPKVVPQASVPSLTLFNLFMHDIPITAYPDIHILSFADDITVFSRHPNPHTTATKLHDDSNTLEQWLHSNRMKVGPSKSTLTLIIPHADEYSLQPTITLNKTPIPYTDTATTLGVTCDKK